MELLKIADAGNFRRTLAGLCLIAAPLAMLASEACYGLVEPENPLDTGQQLAIIAENPGTWQLGVLLGLLAAILFVPAILGMIHLLRGRGVVLGHIGGGLALIGVLGGTGKNVLLFDFGEMAKTGTALGLDLDLMVKITERMEENVVGAIIVLVMGLLGLFSGLLLLSAGLYRARFVPIWVVALPILAFASTFLPILPITIDQFVSIGFLLAALGYVGLKILRMSDEEWELGVAPVADRIVGPTHGTAEQSPQ